MAKEGYASRAVMVSATPLPQAAGATLHWDGRSGVCRECGAADVLGACAAVFLSGHGPAGHRRRRQTILDDGCDRPGSLLIPAGDRMGAGGGTRDL